MPPCSTDRACPVKPSRPTQSDDSALPGDFAQFRYGTKNVARTAVNDTRDLVTAYPAQFREPAEVMSRVPGPAISAGAIPAGIIGKLPDMALPRANRDMAPVPRICVPARFVPVPVSGNASATEVAAPAAARIAELGIVPLLLLWRPVLGPQEKETPGRSRGSAASRRMRLA